MRSLLVLLALLSVCLAIKRPHYKIAGQGNHPAASQAFNPLVNILPLYGIDGSDNTRGAGKTIAIVDAYGASTAQTDLNTFARANGLPAITSANFEKFDQNGGKNYPKDDPDDANGGGWGVEVALDLQAAHAIAPGAKKILITAKTASNANLLAAISTAVNLGADYISLSFGEGEGDAAFDDIFEQAQENGISIFASSGDDGAGVEYPAASEYVVAVGGTTLSKSGSTITETAWSGSGGGCSEYTKAIPEQKAAAGYSSLGCNGNKAVPDVAYNADPNTGAAIVFHGQTIVVGGTSLASPLFAARAALRGDQFTPAYAYTGGVQYRDITKGSNGYSAKVGLDLVTGEGSWIGSD